jgi:hypothetical protein
MPDTKTSADPELFGVSFAPQTAPSSFTPHANQLELKYAPAQSALLGLLNNRTVSLSMATTANRAVVNNRNENLNN